MRVGMCACTCLIRVYAHVCEAAAVATLPTRMHACVYVYSGGEAGHHTHACICVHTHAWRWGGWAAYTCKRMHTHACTVHTHAWRWGGWAPGLRRRGMRCRSRWTPRAHAHTCMHVRMYVCLWTPRAHAHTRMYVRMYVCLPVCMHAMTVPV